MSVPEVKLTKQSEAILEKLMKHVGDSNQDGLTAKEIDRVRANLLREDNTIWVVIFFYNSIIKLAGLLAALSAIYYFSPWSKK